MVGQTLANGQIIPDQPGMLTAGTQRVDGGVLNGAAQDTINQRNHQIETAAKMGAGQKGAGRRKPKRGGASNLNVPASLLPTAGSINGVDPTDTHKAIIDNLNQIRASGVGDKLATAAPYYPAKTGGKRTKRKSKHGRRHHRTHRRGNNKSSRTHRRRRSNV
jgi:hypothetical protein